MKKYILALCLSLALGWTAEAQQLNTSMAVLDNGLKVIMLENHKSPVVTFQIWYKVGSIVESSQQTGLTHLMEHMMFKGTERYPKGEFSKIVARNGGTENAFTSDDYTAYFEKLSSDRLGLSLDLESDRMKNLKLEPREFALELEVVKEERRSRSDDDPAALAMEQLYALAFQVHPYHNPTIGWMSVLENLQFENLSQFYRNYYHPNNAVIVVVGDIASQQLLPQIKQYFAPISQGEKPKRRIMVEPAQRGERRMILRRPAQLPFLAIGYHAPQLNHPDSYALEMLANILSNGRSSRLYQDLIYDKRLAMYAEAFYNRIKTDPEMFGFAAGLQPGKEAGEVEAAIYAQVERIKAELVQDDELAKA